MGIPDWIGVVMFVGLFGVNGIWLAHHLLWQRSPGLFWLASALITIVIGYIVLTGATMEIARSLWPLPFDEIRGKEIQQRASCLGPKLWVTGLILTPIMLALLPWLFKEKRAWARASINAGFVLVFFIVLASPIPAKLEQLAFPDAAQKLPSHCRQNLS